MPIENNPILTIDSRQVTPALKALFSPSDPASLRCQAVLNGRATGRIYADHAQQPTWSVVQEAAFGSIYLGGQLQPANLHTLIARLLHDGDVLVGLWKDDPRWSLLPPAPSYSGSTLEFTDHLAAQPLPPLPPGCQLLRLDATLAKEILGRSLLLHMYNSIQSALKLGYGLCLVRGIEILCETFAGPEDNGVIEVGVETNPHHMGMGYATLTCAHLIDRMELLGYRTYWNCDKDNLPSAALARKLGYGTEMEYPLLAWLKSTASDLPHSPIPIG